MVSRVYRRDVWWTVGIELEQRAAWGLEHMVYSGHTLVRDYSPTEFADASSLLAEIAQHQDTTAASEAAATVSQPGGGDGGQWRYQEPTEKDEGYGCETGEEEEGCVADDDYFFHLFRQTETVAHMGDWGRACIRVRADCFLTAIRVAAQDMPPEGSAEAEAAYARTTRFHDGSWDITLINGA